MSFFTDLFKTAKSIDNSRLPPSSGYKGGPDEWLGLSDVICINRYYGWYLQNGDIAAGRKYSAGNWMILHRQFNKPRTGHGIWGGYLSRHACRPGGDVYGRIPGGIIKAYLDVADTKDFVTGMHIWAFADFKTHGA